MGWTGFVALIVYGGAFTVVFSLIVAVATSVYALFTWQLVKATADNVKNSLMLAKETAEMRKMQEQPLISIYAEPDADTEYFVNMFIHNTGLGPAYDVHFNVKKDIIYAKEYPSGKRVNAVFGFIEEGLAGLNLFQRSWAYFGKNQRIGIRLANMSGDIELFRAYVTPLAIDVTYKNRYGDEITTQNVIDLTYLFGFWKLSPIKEPLVQLQRDVKKIADVMLASQTTEDDK